jgi:hypothetical protein
MTHHDAPAYLRYIARAHYLPLWKMRHVRHCQELPPSARCTPATGRRWLDKWQGLEPTLAFKASLSSLAIKLSHIP